MNGSHGWNSWNDYLKVHESRMHDYEYFVVVDELEAIPTENKVVWRGKIYCLDGIEIRVSKIQDVSHHTGQPMVRTSRYSYHVQQRIGSRVIRRFRYDNVGDHGGDDRHHCHRFDENGSLLRIEQIGADGWPTLGDVITEAVRWWEEWSKRRETTPSAPA